MENYFLAPAMIPDIEILRAPNSKVDDYHYVRFSMEMIKKIRDKFHKEQKDNNVDIEHNGILLKGIYLTKSFLLDDSNIHTIDDQFKDLPFGTWMIEYRIENPLVWQLILDKKLNGFSIEGRFNYEEL